MKEGKSRETKPCIKREEQKSKTLHKKRRTGEQNPIKNLDAEGEKRKTRSHVNCLTQSTIIQMML